MSWIWKNVKGKDNDGREQHRQDFYCWITHCTKGGSGQISVNDIRRHVWQDVTMEPFLPLFKLSHQYESYQLPKGVGDKSYTSTLCRFTEEITLKTHSPPNQIKYVSGQGCHIYCPVFCGLDEGHLGERWGGPSLVGPIGEDLSPKERRIFIEKGQRYVAQCLGDQEGAVRGHQE